MKKKLKRIGLRILKIVLTKPMYCIYVEKKHNMEYRSTVMDNLSFHSARRVHVNVCDNCKMVTYVQA